MYVHEERPLLEYPYPLNPLTSNYGYYPQEWKESVCRTQSWDSNMIGRGEAELTSLPVHVALEGRELWDKFSGIGTEMLITKTGRRMFPSCKVTVTGLNPKVKYVVMMDMVPFDNNKYKWSRDRWEFSGTSEPHLPSRFFIHPDSPAPGERWMQYPISFHKLKLTNNTLNSNGLVVLHSMHKYQPRLHIVQAPDPCRAQPGAYLRFTFPEAAFIAVTAYQNQEITKLKIDNNPFAKGFRDNGLNRKRFREKDIQVKPEELISGQPHKKTHNQHNQGPLDSDEEADETVSSSVESSSVLNPMDLKTPPTAISNPFISAFMNGGVGQDVWSLSPTSHQPQHPLNSNNRDSSRPDPARLSSLQYICSPLPVAHSAQSQSPLAELTLPRRPSQNGRTLVVPHQQQQQQQHHRSQGLHSPAAAHPAFPIQTKLHQSQSQLQLHLQPQPDLDQSLPLPPKLSRVNLPESALRSLEMGSVLDHLGPPRPLSDILNRIHARGVASGSPGKAVQGLPQPDQLPSGLERDARAPFFPAAQDCGTILNTDQYGAPVSEWRGFSGNVGV
ncbi:T-box transcription factor TBX6L isoform X2 [Astyanax mexicanus]|uniref:T-box transcription factor TBX6L isoform X2 n=1 Tax=Astyanax mexicanus TaxID=7994 RepID=UPI0020CB5359|nr:T-box transcription factor TBX6L isoform X2 [Astyanax mexicanus]